MRAMTESPGLAIYIHWPWCLHKCPYCDFNSHASQPQEELYIEALLRDIHAWKPQLPRNQDIASIFIGGGTPSLMKPASIERVLEACYSLGKPTHLTEITVECNPSSTSAEFLHDIRNIGVNRVSIGVQGLQPNWLKFLGRTHTVDEALHTLKAALDLFPAVNADVIYGLPDQSLTEWQNQLGSLCHMGLQHISAYQLTIEPNTRFFTDVKRGLWTPIQDDLEYAFFEKTTDILTKSGYTNYEISNFAKPGFACRHNLHVWQYGSYLGIGAGAHGRPLLQNGQRYATSVVRQPHTYLERFQAGLSPLAEDEPLTEMQQLQERLFLGLRLQEGIRIENLSKHTQNGLYEEALDVEGYEYVCSQGLLEERDGYLRLTKRGWPLLNGILKQILRPLEGDSHLS
jgi:oxygen-independent coproporphyrinogen-3 oxidase